jgi:hypothetical protein
VTTARQQIEGMHMQRLISRPAQAAACVAAFFLLAACGSGETDPGTVRFALTDAPACGFDEVYVSIERIRVSRNADANENSLGWTDLKLSPARRIDLLKLGNGVLEELGQLSLPAGRYAQLRLVLAPNGSAAPANAVVPTDGEETALDISAVEKSGIRVDHPFSVVQDKVTDVLFDFDACRSIATSGADDYVLRPALKSVPRDGASITGYVDAALSSVAVSAQKAGVEARGTVADANGRFVIAFLDPAQSPYDIVLTASGRSTAVVAAVPVSSSAGAELSRIDAPIVLPESTDHSVSGTVGPSAARSTALLLARQTIGSAGEVEVRRVNVDAANGEYVLSLPVAQPRLAAYSTRLPLSFADAGTAGSYSLELSADGYASRLEPVDLTGSSLTWNVTLVRQ